jgi:hypothetical protein
MSLRKRLGVLCIRLAVIVIGAACLFMLPDPQTGELLHFKNAIVSLLSVILVGIALYDTLFYDRQRW